MVCNYKKININQFNFSYSINKNRYTNNNSI